MQIWHKKRDDITMKQILLVSQTGSIRPIVGVSDVVKNKIEDAEKTFATLKSMMYC